MGRDEKLHDSFVDLIYEAVADKQQALELLDAFFSMSGEDMDVEEMLPHIRRVEQIFALMDDSENHVRQLLDQMPLAVVVADEAGRVLEANRMAGNMLDGGNHVRIEEGRLCLASEDYTRRLRHAIADIACSGQKHSRMLSFSHDDGSLKVMVRRGFVAEALAGESGRSLVCISFSGCPAGVREHCLSERWGLTPKEARVAVQFARHPDIADLAKRLHRSEHTIRSQIKAIFRKTGASNQAELMRLLLDQGQDMSQILADSPAANENDAEYCRLPDGRTLAYSSHGTKTGAPVIYLHSFTGCRTECAQFVGFSERFGVRLIAPDRPGFGLSPPAPEMTFRDWPRFIEWLADDLRIRRFYMLAMSGSSAYALACALAMPERIRGMALISPMGEVHSARDVRDMLPLNRRVLEIMLRSPPSLCRFIAHLMARAFSTDISAYLERILPHVAESDRSLLANPRIRGQIEQQFIESRRHCREAFGEDMIRYSRPWELELERITVPVTLWHGTDNRHIPIAMARRLASRIPGCRTRWLSGEGYYLNFTHGESILADLVASD